MVIQLLRKDFLIAKNFIIVTLIILAALQVVSVFELNPENPSVKSFIFLFSVMFGVILIFSAISQYEVKYSKAVTLLCAVPYSKEAIVKSKFLSLILIFAYCLIINMLATLIIRKTEMISIPVALTIMMVITTIACIYLPIEFKYGYVKTKFIFRVLVLVVAFLPQIIVNYIRPGNSVVLGKFISKIAQIQMPVLCLILALIIVLVFIISLRKSISIFNKKEL